ncbi:hypothetical protein BAUCODRAFT_61027 [Baudoinia panamericana UAMH 10762]|uniref:Steroid 5-alpha reductase C-terminal domain-containing protein n=1 Tax=Baudoinia panamericana (strain UAMH 10762) TaxID=717646 RepID=M2NN85_BAUPA|nr:uncharacterized protein BAUCODRAFT_61027 [Baudoinia panamericana UAMH 10762]EMD00691.1 hypothetical protein BAUCODRAFT_61027 [Baudoinia panamericana UAMH 10762]
MAMPLIRTFRDCATYSKTFAPYLPQLTAFPRDILASIPNLGALQQVYTSTNPIISGLAFSIALFPVFFGMSEVTGNYSQVDRVWGVLPTLYHIHYALWARLAGVPTQKVNAVLLFSLCWTTRLTFNYWRRGGYQAGSEDYRWKLIRDRIGRPAFLALNVVFTSSLQSVLLWSVTNPTYILLLTSRLSPALTPVDMAFTGMLLSLVGMTWLADQQQWDYHAAKHSYQETARVPSGWTRAQMERGFNTTGLWRYSRHPNFASEQSIWLTLYAWGCYSSGTLYNWTGFGVLSYLLIFAGSTPITEGTSSGKYPQYKVYQERVGRFIPKLFGKGWDEAEMEKRGNEVVAEAEGKGSGGKKQKAG